MKPPSAYTFSIRCDDCGATYSVKGYEMRRNPERAGDHTPIVAWGMKHECAPKVAVVGGVS